MTIAKLLTYAILGCALHAQTSGTPETLPSAQGLELTLTAPSGPVTIGAEATVGVKLTNQSDMTYSLGEAQAEFAFALHLYDSNGTVVPYSPEGEFVWRHAHSVFGSTPLLPGQTINVQEDLSRIFAITTPGVYLIKGYSRLVEGFQPVTAQPIRIVFQSSVTDTGRTSAQGLRFLISADPPTAAAGSPIDIDITVFNKSKNDIDASTIVYKMNGSYSVYSFEVRDAAHHLVPRREYPHLELSSASAYIRTIKAGEILKDKIAVSRIYDMSQPGVYTIRVSSKVPKELGQDVVLSNQIRVTVTGSDPN